MNLSVLNLAESPLMLPESLLEGYLKRLLGEADVQINGSRPWDLQVLNRHFFWRVFLEGSLGLGESYMEGWWECRRLDQMFTRIFQASLPEKFSGHYPTLFLDLASWLFNRQSKSRSGEVGKKHYDLGNDLYEAMLDTRMMYSCAYWKKATTLNQAQKDKLDLICQKLYLKPGMTLLDIGCGWGGLAKYATENYGVKVVGITISQEQAALAKKQMRHLPVEIRLQDYREVRQKFDRIVSVGMLEHVGYKNYLDFMKAAHRCLKHEGLFLLHTIGGNQSVYSTDPWIDRYIFPNSVIPSMKQLAQSMEGLFVVEDWHNFGAYYDKTLMAWQANFKVHWKKLNKRYDQKFYRMWNYYLLSCAATFRARKNQVWQMVLSKKGMSGGYVSVR